MKEIEKKTCGRCGGVGKFSWNQISGDTCFGCNGTGKQLTKRGKAAADLFIARTTVPVGEVKVGDRIRDRFTGTFTVASIERTTSGERILKDGTRETIHVVNFKTTGGREFGFDTHCKVRLILPPKEHNELLAEVIDFQETLTKAGKPKKRLRDTRREEAA